ncbi:MAG: hypothetical protein CVT67_02840 [Actinobacteria bacterium HGW-Actinobacteria-7]|jgi:hypothetical protein|nr:MAG: hypothetical protein CVT67_02840 [Actinobacteria bacterium HGW-Actinobacteria-7]
MSDATRRVIEYDPFEDWSFSQRRCFLCGSQKNVTASPVFPDWIAPGQRELLGSVRNAMGAERPASSLILYTCAVCYPAVSANDKQVRQSWPALPTRVLERDLPVRTSGRGSKDTPLSGTDAKRSAQREANEYRTIVYYKDWATGRRTAYAPDALANRNATGGTVARLRNHEDALYLWMLRLYWGLLANFVGDVPPSRRPQLSMFAGEEVLDYQQLHVFLSGMLEGVIVNGGPPPWSIFVTETQFLGDTGALDPIDVGWHFQQGLKAVAFRYGGAGVVCCLEDNGAERLLLDTTFRKLVSASLHPVQFEEWWATIVMREYTRLWHHPSHMVPVNQPEAGLLIKSFGSEQITASVSHQIPDRDTWAKHLHSYLVQYDPSLAVEDLQHGGVLFGADGQVASVEFARPEDSQPTDVPDFDLARRIRALYEHEYDGVDELLAALDDPIEDVREAAAHTLRDEDDRRAFLALARVIDHESSATVRHQAYESLSEWGKFGDEHNAVLALFVSAFRTESDPQCRADILFSIDWFSEISGVPDLVRAALADSEPVVRLAGINFIDDAGIDDAYEALASMLDDDDEGVRAKAKERLRYVPKPDTFGSVPLDSKVSEPEPTIQHMQVPAPPIISAATPPPVGERCEHCGVYVDFTGSGACPTCGSFQGWPAGIGPREEEHWIEAQKAGERVQQRQDAERPFVESTTKQENFMGWVIGVSLVVGVLATLARCSS